jgi:hypothetical protein
MAKNEGDNMKKIITAVIALSASLGFAGLVQFDLSGVYNYDAFVTGEEIAYATGDTVAGTIGDHAVSYNHDTTEYAHLVDPNASTYKGIASSGVVAGGKYELGKGLTTKWGTPAGDTPVNNSLVSFFGDGLTTREETITLAAGDQKQYSNFNILVNGSRYNTGSGPFSATLSVKYVGDSNWYTVWTETAAIGEIGGVFGGAYGGDANAYSQQSSDWTAIEVSDNGYAKTVSSLTVGGNGRSYMYELTTDAILDPTKTLESFKMVAVQSASNRVNEFALYAATGTEAVPEPATIGMLGLGALVAAAIRRLRG